MKVFKPQVYGLQPVTWSNLNNQLQPVILTAIQRYIHHLPMNGSTSFFLKPVCSSHHLPVLSDMAICMMSYAWVKWSLGETPINAIPQGREDGQTLQDSNTYSMLQNSLSEFRRINIAMSQSWGCRNKCLIRIPRVVHPPPSMGITLTGAWSVMAMVVGGGTNIVKMEGVTCIMCMW